MPKLPVLSGKEIIKKLEKIGYSTVRQKGSHVRLHHKNSQCKPITVPMHKEIKTGLLSRILKDANVAVDEFINL